MPFLDCVNKAQAQCASANVPYHLLQFESAHGDAAAENLLIQGDNLLALKALQDPSVTQARRELQDHRVTQAHKV